MGLSKKNVFTALMIFGCNRVRINPLKFVSINNKECKVRPEIININSNEPLFYPFSVKISSGNVMVVAMILMIHMQNYVFPMLSKT